MGLSTSETWLERVGDDAFEGLSFSRPTMSGPLCIGGAIAAIYGVVFSQQFPRKWGAVVKGHTEGH